MAKGDPIPRPGAFKDPMERIADALEELVRLKKAKKTKKDKPTTIKAH